MLDVTHCDPSSTLFFCNLIHIYIRVKGQFKGVVMFTYVQFPGYKTQEISLYEKSWVGILIPNWVLTSCKNFSQIATSFSDSFPSQVTLDKFALVAKKWIVLSINVKSCHFPFILLYYKNNKSCQIKISHNKAQSTIEVTVSRMN